ncbi:hypothetical protein Glove_60g65 [Diversispora epigaea]|uniref:Protein kinase domain-containing protein n=1 Tax=Diversispora epigaea TaxID=1348612 RepID=A0A397JCL9_9GLOM|nr:hypothetical protein Glove_60g65 [Diversispora epigaea]
MDTRKIRNNYLENRIKNESSLTENETNFLLNHLKKIHDEIRIENNFGNWTSGNNEIHKTTAPDRVIEWIEYDKFDDVEHLTEGGCTTIYTAIWNDGSYDKWDPERKILERFGQKIVLKKLNNSNNNNNNNNTNVTLSFTLDKTSSFLANCYGLTKDPTTQDYMLVLNHYDNNLRQFLKGNYQSLTLLQKYNIISDITNSSCEIHYHDITHRDLHSGNFLYNSRNITWNISDLGLSGPVDKQLDSIYGNLPYIAPEILYKRVYTTKSDVYSLGIIMWEVITGETLFSDLKFNSDSDFALAIINGYRPKIYEYIPNEYANLLKQCWDADPDNRPDARTIYDKLSQPRNVTEEEQDAYETKQFDFEISEVDQEYSFKFKFAV